MFFFYFLCLGGLHVCLTNKIPSEPGWSLIIYALKQFISSFCFTSVCIFFSSRRQKYNLKRTIDNNINCGLSTTGHHVATGDHGYSGQSDQRFPQLHLHFPARSGNSVSAAFSPAHTDTARAFARGDLRQLALRRGSAIANALSQVAMCLLLFFYIVCRGLHKTTWGGE